MTRTCKSCPVPHPMYLQAEPDWYRPSAAENVRLAVGCLAQMAGAILGAFVLWGLLVALFVGGAA